MSLKTVEISQCCSDNSVGYVGIFPEGNMGICSEHFRDETFMRNCSKLFLFPSLKEVPISQ